VRAESHEWSQKHSAVCTLAKPILNSIVVSYTVCHPERSEGPAFRCTARKVMLFVKLASQVDLPALNEVKEFPCGGRMICVANVNGEISAMDNICLHRGGPLGEGMIEGGKVICPWHGWAWDPKTGEAQTSGAKIAVYPVKIEGEDVLIEI
jgi:nitrite reductase (NADH) small subunit